MNVDRVEMDRVRELLMPQLVGEFRRLREQPRLVDRSDRDVGEIAIFRVLAQCRCTWPEIVKAAK